VAAASLGPRAYRSIIGIDEPEQWHRRHFIILLEKSRASIGPSAGWRPKRNGKEIGGHFPLKNYDCFSGGRGGAHSTVRRHCRGLRGTSPQWPLFKASADHADSKASLWLRTFLQ
jgi:hypothetical protein